MVRDQSSVIPVYILSVQELETWTFLKNEAKILKISWKKIKRFVSLFINESHEYNLASLANVAVRIPTM